MQIKLVIAAFASFALASSFVTPLSAQDDKKPAGQAAPSPDEMKAMMELFEKTATPGEPHKLLQKLAGKWNTVAKTTEMPGMPSEESKGTAEARSVLGGRQIIEESKSTMMGKEFQGLFVIGYDNVTKEFVSTWADSWNTGHYMTRGTADATGKIITLNGEVRDAMSPDKPRAWRLVIKIESDDKHVVEIYDTMSPGNLVLGCTVTATRAK